MFRKWVKVTPSRWSYLFVWRAVISRSQGCALLPPFHANVPFYWYFKLRGSERSWGRHVIYQGLNGAPLAPKPRPDQSLFNQVSLCFVLIGGLTEDCAKTSQKWKYTTEKPAIKGSGEHVRRYIVPPIYVLFRELEIAPRPNNRVCSKVLKYTDIMRFLYFCACRRHRSVCLP